MRTPPSRDGADCVVGCARRCVLKQPRYSDEVTVFMNGRPLFAGTTGWECRAPEYAAFVDARHESVWLPLRAGENELTVVADDQRFGWGFAVVLDDPDLAVGARPTP